MQVRSSLNKLFEDEAEDGVVSSDSLVFRWE